MTEARSSRYRAAFRRTAPTGMEDGLRLRSDQNKDGTALGRKGAETRARLLAATRTLLETVSPFNLTVAAIAKAARTAPATLYVYFNDVQDVFYALSVEACQDFEAMTCNHPEWFTDPARIDADGEVCDQADCHAGGLRLVLHGGEQI